MNKFFNKHIPILIVVLLVSSCKSSLSIENYYDLPPMLFGNIIISNQGFSELEIYKSSPNIDQPYIVLQEANISFYENNQLIDEYNLSSGKHLAHNMTPGKTYSIEVSVPGLPTIYGQDVFPELINIENAIYSRESIVIDSNTEIDVGLFSLSFNDTPGKENYYLVKLYTLSGDEKEYTSYLQTFNPVVPVAFNNFLENAMLFSDHTFEGQKFNIEFFVNGYQMNKIEQSNEQVYIELLNISNSYFKYLTSLNLYGRANSQVDYNPLQPIEVYNNIENGLGIFASYQSDYSALQLK